MERIEPIRRDEPLRSVPAVEPVERRPRDGRRDDRRRDRRRPDTPPVITRDDDGTPHVDIRV